VRGCLDYRDNPLPGQAVRIGSSVEWQALTRTESLFFAARDRYEAGQAFDWATLALDEGFSDQSHLGRASKRITGFSPTEFARRFAEDESFWLYRIWV
jgi:AraC-like DNA-binding protein